MLGQPLTFTITISEDTHAMRSDLCAKSSILFLLSSLFLSLPIYAQTGPLFHDCPIEGDATPTTRSDPDLNLLKNRSALPTDGFTAMHFDDLTLLEVPEGVSKKHRTKWPEETLNAVKAEEMKAVQVPGFLVNKKLEGPESPNCHSSNQADRDFHVWLANSSADEKADAIVVEITPRVRAEHPTWTATNLGKLILNKSQVRISGWIMLDPEHLDEVGKSRATIWEIHPILKIEVFSAGKWQDL
jgi:hypothetical protein